MFYGLDICSVLLLRSVCGGLTIICYMERKSDIQQNHLILLMCLLGQSKEPSIKYVRGGGAVILCNNKLCTFVIIFCSNVNCALMSAFIILQTFTLLK